MRTSKTITSCYLRSQGVELLCGRLRCVLWNQQLPFANRMHDFNPRDRTAGGPQGLEAEHRTREPFHRSMVLLHDIIQILGVADHNGGLVRLIVVRNCCRVRAAFIDRDFLREPLGALSQSLRPILYIETIEREKYH